MLLPSHPTPPRQSFGWLRGETVTYRIARVNRDALFPKEIVHLLGQPLSPPGRADDDEQSGGSVFINERLVQSVRLSGRRIKQMLPLNGPIQHISINTGTTDVLPPPQSTTIDDDLPTENAARTDVFAI